MSAYSPIDHSQCVFFFFNHTATTKIYTLSLHDALPIRPSASHTSARFSTKPAGNVRPCTSAGRSEEHTSELQSRFDVVCRLLLEKKKNYLLVCTELVNMVIGYL